MTDERFCECGCGQRLANDATSRTRYVDGRHRQHAYRERRNRELEAAGIPVRLSLRTARAARATSVRNGDAQTDVTRPRSRSGLQVSYRKVLDLVACVIVEQYEQPVPDETARVWAEDLVRPLLPQRQRDRLEARR